MIDQRCPWCNALLLRSEGHDGSILVECRNRRCRRLVSYNYGSTGMYLWDARCYQCSRLLYRHTNELSGEFETKCRSCRYLDRKRLRIPAYSTG
jgi:phage FluMu protein Com